MEPLYTVADAAQVAEHLVTAEYGQIIELFEGVKIRFGDAGHLLGSASVEMWMEEGGVEKKIVFSGDIGNVNQPIIRDPSWVHGADYVVMESTYGDRNHAPVASYTAELAKIIDDTFSKGGNVIIPSFAVGRTQELLYFMREMKKEGLVKSNPDFTVCVDSPLANEATKIFSGDLRGYLDEEALEVVKEGERLFTFPGLMMTESSEESKLLNLDKSSKVIISASGMCDAARIRHHLKHNLWREECAIVNVCNQGEGTLGRHLLEGAKQVRLFGEEIAVNASIYNFQGLSSHADRDHLLQWIDQVKDPAPQQIFVVHGDAQVTEIFANTLRKKGLPAHAPLYEEVFDLARNVMLAAGVEIAPKKTSFASTLQSRTYKMQMYSHAAGGFENAVDELNGKQLSFDNLLICFAPIAAYPGDSGDVQQVNYISGGEAYFFSRGGVQVGRWEKASPEHPLKVYDDAGAELLFNRGKTYLAIVDDDEWSNFSYQ